ncbi:hypothetical protein CYMTET_25898, partial [Cymbomonas tetramitiformis]
YMGLLTMMVACASPKSLEAHKVGRRASGRCNCAGLFCCVFYVPLLAGCLALSLTVLDDSCGLMISGTAASNGKGLLQVNADYSVEVGDTTVDLSASIVQIVRCPEGCSAPGSVGCDSGNNLVSLLSLQDEFNYTSNIQDPLQELRDAGAELNVTEDVASAKASLNSEDVANALAYDLKQDWNMSYYDEQFAELVDVLPNSTDSSQQGRWEAVWQEYPPSAETVESNMALLQEVEYAWYLVRAVDGNLTRATELQASLNLSLDHINSYLDQIEFEVDQARKDLELQEKALEDLVHFVFSESFGYMRCGWIGSSYKKLVEDQLCGDVSNALESCKTWLAAGAAMVYLSMITSLHLWQHVDWDVVSNVQNGHHDERSAQLLYSERNDGYHP